MEQAPFQKIVDVVEAHYLADIRNRMMNSIHGTVAGVLMHLQENYGQLMLHELLEWEDIVNEKNYNQRDPITNVFFAVN